jgi:hypothetical protein
MKYNSQRRNFYKNDLEVATEKAVQALGLLQNAMIHLDDFRKTQFDPQTYYRNEALDLLLEAVERVDEAVNIMMD